MVPNAHDTHPARYRFAPAIAPLLIWCGLLLLLREVPPDGREHGNAAQFLGRFHVLLVHGPLALLLLIPVLELAGRRSQWPHFRAVTGPLLSLAAFLTFATALDGWLLAWSGGYRGHGVTLHMWSGAWLAGICGAASLARCGALPRAAYPTLLAAAVALTLWTGHTGGSITHGDDFLTEKLPARMRAWLAMSAAPPKAAAEAPGGAKAVHAGPGSADPANPAFYAVHIAPLMARSCVSCHKPEKRKGGLLMDTYAHLMRGGEDGAVVVPGNPKASEILRRVRLPANDDDSMPSDGDKPLAAEEIQMIERWIAAGAKGG